MSERHSTLHEALSSKETFFFNTVLRQTGFNPLEAKIRLNWGSPESPELVPSDLIHAAQLGLIRPEEFRKNAVKFGWELWEAKQESSTSDDATVTRNN